MKTIFPRATTGGLLGFLIAIAPSAQADSNWTSFRNGGASHHNMALPTEWSADANIIWQRELVGYGQSSPVVFDGAIYTTSVVGPNCETCVIQCSDLDSGEVRWTFRRDATHGHPSNYMNARAAPTPVVNDQGVFAFFETGDLVAVDLSGNLLWSVDMSEKTGKFDNSHGVGSSLAQNETHVFLNLEHGGPSFLTAIDKNTGQPSWTVDRESSKSWSSPIIADLGDRQQVILSSGGSVTGYDTADGTKLWSLDGIEGNSVPSPTLAGNFLLIGARLPEFASDGDVRSNCCLDLSEIENGQPKVVWRADKAICEYASPVVIGQHAYFLSKADVLHCLEIETGDVLYRKRLKGDVWATPIVADGKLFFFCKNGTCHVVAGGEDFELLSTNRLWDPESPPAPESYVESSGSRGRGHGGRGSSHSSHGGGNSGASDSHQPGASGGPPRGRAGGMVARMMAGDQNGDGILEKDEIPEMFRGMLSRIDSNADGKLDKAEIDAMTKSFAERRKNAAASARDPIVYGVAASGDRIIVRTGTRLYVIGDPAGQS